MDSEEVAINILREAENIVHGQRAQDYGDMSSSFKRIAAMWSAYLDTPINWLDVAHMMIMLKVSRGKAGYKHDSIVDIIGYSYCADRIHDSELAKNSKFNGEY